MNIEQNMQRYLDAAHAMQSGVAYEMYERDTSEDRDYKDLRVGINSTMVTNAALASLMVEKGIFTMEEYAEANANEMEAEVQRYQDRAPSNIRFR